MLEITLKLNNPHRIVQLKQVRWNIMIFCRNAEGGASAISNTINNICKYDYLLNIRHPVNLKTAAKRGYPVSIP